MTGAGAENRCRRPASSRSRPTPAVDGAEVTVTATNSGGLGSARLRRHRRGRGDRRAAGAQEAADWSIPATPRARQRPPRRRGRGRGRRPGGGCRRARMERRGGAGGRRAALTALGGPALADGRPLGRRQERRRGRGFEVRHRGPLPAGGRRPLVGLVEEDRKGFSMPASLPPTGGRSPSAPRSSRDLRAEQLWLRWSIHALPDSLRGRATVHHRRRRHERHPAFGHHGPGPGIARIGTG